MTVLTTLAFARHTIWSVGRKCFSALGVDAVRLGLAGLVLLRAPWQRTKPLLATVEDAHYWEHVKELLRLSKIDLVVDVGANAGQFASGMRAIGFTGTIVSFEPIPELAEQLRVQAKADSQWIIYELALGATSGEAAFEIAASTDFSSFRTPSAYAQRVFSKVFEEKRLLRVRLERLENVFQSDSRLSTAKNVFLKIDTQGFDLEVIAGIGNVRSSIVLVQSELSLEPLYENVPSFNDSLEAFRIIGFRPCGFFPVCRDKSQGFLVEVDCLFRSYKSL